MKLKSIPAVIAVLLSTNAFSAANSKSNTTILAPIMVSADLRNINEDKIATSISVLNQQALEDRGATHFEDILLQLPNVNFSGQSSRPRHIQIRGQGERDEYTGRPNPSVGFAIDDIDFSGIGMIGSLFDVKQVEVLRGPQSTRYGSNAIAGLINITTNEPTPYQENMIEISGGQDNLKELGLMTSGSFNEDKKDSPQYRLSLFKHISDGFRHNAYLNRNNTNGRNELYLRGKLRFTPSNETQIDLTLLHANLNNGYDAWSRDNTFTTLSDQPGKDDQRTTAGAVKAQWSGNSNFLLTSITTLANSKMLYSYDGDWGSLRDNNTYFYSNDKNRDTVSQEFRFTSTPNSKLFNNSTDWLLGFYSLQLKENNHTTDNFGTNLRTNYRDTKLATFGQLDFHLSKKQVLSTGLRIENQGSHYSDSNAESYKPNETLWGGHITFTQQLSPQHNAYIGISQGYKSSGFNTGLTTGSPANLLRFSKETAINYEIGLKSHSSDNSLSTAISLFYTDRRAPQFHGYTYVKNNYVYYTENFDTATNYGLESEFDWQTNKQWKFFGSLGLLETNVKGTPLSAAFTINGREQAHAPTYQYTVGTQFRNGAGFYGRITVTGVNSFYFSNSNTAKSNPYTLTNARIGYETEAWEIYLWGRNIFDQKYATRGFFFALPPDSIEKKYIHLGDPRQIGVTARLHF